MVIVGLLIRPAVSKEFESARTSVEPIMAIDDDTLKLVTQQRGSTRRRRRRFGDTTSPLAGDDQQQRRRRPLRQQGSSPRMSLAPSDGNRLFGDVPIDQDDSEQSAAWSPGRSPPVSPRELRQSRGGRRPSCGVITFSTASFGTSSCRSKAGEAVTAAASAAAAAMVKADDDQLGAGGLGGGGADNGSAGTRSDDSDDSSEASKARQQRGLAVGGPSSAATGASPPASHSARPRRVSIFVAKEDSDDEYDEECADGKVTTAAAATAAAAAADKNNNSNSTKPHKTDSVAAPQSRETNEERNRYYRVVAVYTTAFLMITGSLVALTAFAAVSVSDTRSAGAELNNGGRMRGLLARNNFVSREMVLLGDAGAPSLQGGLLDMFESEESVRCFAREASNALTSVHINLVSGDGAWRDTVPSLTGWPAVSHDAPCTAFTPVEPYFLGSMDLPGMSGRNARIDDLLYRNSCLTDLGWDSGSSVSGNERVQFYMASMSPNKCTLWQEGDPRVQQGLHPLLLSATKSFRDLAAAPLAALGTTHPAWQFVTRYSFGSGSSPELTLGLLRLILEMQAAAQDVLDDNELVVVLLVSLATIVAVAQHAALSRLLGGVIRKNIGLRMTVERLVAYAEHCRAAAAEGELARKEQDQLSDGQRKRDSW